MIQMFLLSSIFSPCAQLCVILAMNISSLVCFVCFRTGTQMRERVGERVWEKGTERGLTLCFWAVWLSWCSGADVWGHTVIPAPTEAQSISYDSLPNSVADWPNVWLNSGLADWMNAWMTERLGGQANGWLVAWLPSCTDVSLNGFLFSVHTLTNWLSTELTDKSANQTTSQWPRQSLGVMTRQLIRQARKHSTYPASEITKSLATYCN